MKRIKKILTGCICVLAVVLLGAYGLGMFDKQEQEDIAQEEEKTQEKEETSGEERLYQEELGIEYPAAPETEGEEIVYDEDFTMPPDESIENLYVYEVHDMFEGGEKEQEEYADTLSEKILTDFFPGEKWDREVVSYTAQHNYVYRIQGKEENAFQYTANKDGGDNSQLLCEPGEITVPVPEDGDYDKAYQDFSMEMLKYFQVGLWDGENVHMTLTDTKDVTETGGYYQYRVEFDGIKTTKYTDMFSDQRMVWASFHYEDGSLLCMLQMAERVLDGKRECKPMYSSVAEAVDALGQAMEMYYKEQARSFGAYFVANVENVSLEYVGDTKKEETVYVPILNAYIQEGSYDISEGTWKWRNVCYAIQLETGETDAGTDDPDVNDIYAWEAPMTDRLDN